MTAKRTISLAFGVYLTVLGLPPFGGAKPAFAEHAEGPMTVELASGRTFTGDVDSRSDGELLWLRQDLASGYLLRPIDWNLVKGVHLAGEHFSGDDFHAAVRELKRRFADRAETTDPTGEVVLTDSGKGVKSTSTRSPVTSTDDEQSSTVCSLAFHARLANWDSDVEADGLIINVYPLEATGAVVPVRGMLEVDLLVERTGVVKRPQPFVRLGRWTKQVALTDFGSQGAAYRLPFQSINPEFDRDWASYGAVHARLSVPGQGVFDSTEGMVRIIPYSPVRDRLEQTTGRRFFHMERIGPGSR